MKKIVRFNLKTQPHDALFDFILFVHKSLIYLPQAETTPGQPEVQRAESDKIYLKSERLQRVVDKFESAFQWFDDAYMPDRKSPVTKALGVAERNQHKAWVGMSRYLRSMIDHPVAEVAAAARAARELLEKNGNPRHGSQGKKSTIVYSLLQDLETFASREKVGLDPWYEWLKAAHEAFKQLMHKRACVKDRTKIGETPAAVAAAKKAYRELVNVVNSIVVVEETDNYDTFINILNGEIEERTTIAKRQATRRKNAKLKTNAPEAAEATAPRAQGGKTKEK